MNHRLQINRSGKVPRCYTSGKPTEADRSGSQTTLSSSVREHVPKHYPEERSFSKAELSGVIRLERTTFPAYSDIIKAPSSHPPGTFQAHLTTEFIPTALFLS